MFPRLVSTTILLFLLPSIAPAHAGGGSGRVQVQPENVWISIFYSGQKVRVKVAAPDQEAIVMRVVGAEEPLVLKKKRKEFGFLWMNVGEVHYEAVPALYMLRSSRRLDEIAAPETLQRLKLGFDALRDQVSAQSEDGAAGLFGELVKLKEKDHLYSSEAGGVDLVAAGAGGREATGEFLLPAKTPVGDYTVDVFGFQKQKAELFGTATIHVRRDAAVSAITSLATKHGFLYGCLAVAVAILAGLFTGFIFRR